MRILRIGLLFTSILLLPAAVVVAQQPSTTVPRDAEAFSLLQRSFAALTGTTTINDVTLSGTVTRIAGSDNESGTATLRATAVGQGRMDLSLPSSERSEVRDISANPPTGSWLGPDGTWHAIAGHNLLTDPSWFFPQFLIQRTLSNPSYQISSMDAETQEGVAVEHISISQPSPASGSQAALIQSLGQIDIYLNSTTLLPTAIAFNVHPDDNALVNIPIEIRFSNYQAVQGLSVPYHIQKYIQNGLALDVSVAGVQVNSGLSAADFQAQ